MTNTPSSRLSLLEPNPGVSRIRPYVQGKSAINGVADPVKLSSNESSHGPSPKAVAAFEDTASILNRYADGSQSKLRTAIAQVHDLDPDRVVCGNGSDEIIQLMVRAYVREGDEALLSENGFVMANIHCMAQGADLVFAAESNYRVSVDNMLEAVTPKTRFCTIANPNNPTGTYLSGADLRRLREGLPERCLLLIDNAYAEYVEAEDFEDGTALVNDYSNVVMSRTFSKIYGLPALRIGWAYCASSVIDHVNRIRTPFNTNGPAMSAATAAVLDQQHVATIKAHNLKALSEIAAELTATGIEVIPSVANFYLLRFPSETRKNGTGADQFLQARGIIPRPAGGSDEFLRITVGLDEENAAVISALKAYMAS
nr:histidinol-phosphate aminotransferase-like [Nerophis lumbriciformis]